MGSFLNIVLALVLVQQVLAYQPRKICPANEVYNECGSACPLTCGNYKDGLQMCTGQCVPGCECAEGYVRNEADNKCCLESECPENEHVCPANEIFNECGTACPLTCDNYKDPPEFCTMQCVIGCQCAPGYVRNEADGTCCLESECPETEVVCSANEVFTECGTACPLSCDNYENPPEFCTEQCVVGCQCAPGYVRNEADGSCCLESECPAETEQVCPANEKYNACGTACPLTCDNYKAGILMCTDQCVPGCECAEGYVRNEADGSCCLESECPDTEQVCPANEVYNECGTACPITCDNYKDGPQVCTRQCVPGCECAEGYVRNEADGKCCLESECPETEQVCPANEIYTECGTACPLTCDNYENPPEFCTMQCVIGCQCAPGYVRNEADGTCCLESECPAKHVCPANEVYNGCGTACPATCNNYKNGPRACTLQCVPGCECVEGYVRNEADGTCCLESECPEIDVICPANEVFNECGSACPFTCDNYKNPPKFCTMQCVIGCQCAPGYVRNEANGKCCLASECPGEQICPANEIFNECGSACPLTCGNYKNPPRFCTKQCVIGCQCAPGYVRNEADGKCCLKSQCPAPHPVCPLNEEYNSCGSACPDTCDNYKNKSRVCTKQCVSGCQCKKGYVRRSDGVCCLPAECVHIKPSECGCSKKVSDCGCSNKTSDCGCSKKPSLLSAILGLLF